MVEHGARLNSGKSGSRFESCRSVKISKGRRLRRMEMWLGADWNYINFGFNGMEFPVPVKVGRQMPKVLAETCDGYSAIRVRPKSPNRRAFRRAIN